MMPTVVRSYSKINLGLAIGPPRPDGFHGLTTLYQTLALHDLLTVTARRADTTVIRLSSSDHRVPTDARNTVWKMVEKTLARLTVTADVSVYIQKNLPIQGGMGAGSANAAAALIGLARELELDIDHAVALEIAAEVGSDVPLFLVGGSVFGTDRGQIVSEAPDVTLDGQTEIACVMALPRIGVSTPQAFRDWDRRYSPSQPDPDLHNGPVRDTMVELSRTYASVFSKEIADSTSGASGIFPEPGIASSKTGANPEKLHGSSREQLHQPLEGVSGNKDDLAENTLLALVRTGMENDFETVVFPQYPSLREIKRHLMGTSESGNNAICALLSGSGSALFGLYRSNEDAQAAQQRLQQHGVQALVTKTLPRPLYWSDMFAE